MPLPQRHHYRDFTGNPKPGIPKIIMEYKDPGRYISIIFPLYSWGSLFGVPSKVPLITWVSARQAIFP